MEDDFLWCLVYSSVLGLRFHPKNDESRDGIEAEIELAAKVADSALAERKRRV